MKSTFAITAFTAIAFAGLLAVAAPGEDFLHSDASNEIYKRVSNKALITACSNDGKLKRDKFLKQGCDPNQSKGFRSSHECKSDSVGGRAYLCVLSGQSACINLRNDNTPYEGGECFK
ncbi:hypothetical protein CPC08DRAFT_757401 [Agrocybe pediades]|nr:hypothetical protein CPC08DRAFT_757401 [Agrocybe pediades]